MNKKQVRRSLASPDVAMAIRTRIRQLAAECGINVSEAESRPGTVFAGQAVASVVWKVLGYGDELVNDFDVFRCSILGGKHDSGDGLALIGGSSVAVRYGEWIERSSLLYRIKRSIRRGKANITDVSIAKDWTAASRDALARMFMNHIVDMFDINSTMVAYSPYLDELYIHDRFVEFLASKEIRMVNARTLGRSYARAIKKSMEIPWASLDTASLGIAIRAIRYGSAEMYANIGTALKDASMPSKYTMRIVYWFVKQHGVKSSVEAASAREEYIMASPVSDWDFVASSTEARSAIKALLYDGRATHVDLPILGDERRYLPIQSRFDAHWKHEMFPYRTGYENVDRYFRICDAAMRKRIALRKLPQALVSAGRIDFFDYFNAIGVAKMASSKKLRELDGILTKAFAMMEEWTKGQSRKVSVFLSTLVATQARNVLTGGYNDDIRTLIGLIDRYGNHTALSAAIMENVLNVRDARIVYAKINEAVKRHGKMVIGLVETKPRCGVIDILYAKDWWDRIGNEVAKAKRAIATPLKGSRFQYEDDRLWIMELVTLGELDREGKMMQHCVGGYGSIVRSLHSAIFACRHKPTNTRFTMEVKLSSGKYEVVQAKGKRNRDIGEAIWQEFLDKIAEIGVELKEYKPLELEAL